MEENIHNDFFISLIKYKNNARDFLKLSLPEEISSKIDFNYIQYDDTSYIQNRFKDLFSDIVIKTKTEDKDTDIYILIEHKSTLPDKRALFLQILSYIYSMYEKDFKDKNDFRIIIPLVFYHGVEKWGIPEEFLDLYNVGKEIKSKLLNFRYILFDTKDFEIENSEIMHKNLILAAGMIALKTAFNKKDIDSVVKIIENLYKEGILRDFKRIEIFLIYAIKTKEITEDKIIEIINKYDPEGGSYMLTLENYFTEKGLKKGIKKGIKKGLKKGEMKGKIKTAKAMKCEGIDIKVIAKVTGLSIEEIEKL